MALKRNEALNDTLRSADPQVRLNAAVRLAYDGSVAGLDDLVAGLEHESFSIRFTQVPEAIALLGGVGLDSLRRLVGQKGTAQIPAARALVLLGQFDGVVEAVVDALSDPASRWMAALLAGEVGQRAVGASEALKDAIRASDDGLPIGLSALVAMAGMRAFPFVKERLTHASPEVRMAAMRALCGVGCAASSTSDALADSVRDDGLTLRERLTAAHTLARVSSRVDDAAATLGTVIQRTTDRWLQVGLLREVAQVCPGYPLQPESSPYQWPQWEAQLLYASPPRHVDQWKADLLSLLVGLLKHEDYDVRRNAAFALAFWEAPGHEVISETCSASQLGPHVRHDLLRRLGETSQLDPAGFPWDIAMTQPAVDLDAIAGPCERLWADAQGGDIDYAISVEKWAFLRYLVERRSVLLHGSRTPGINVLQPISRSGGGTRTSDQPGVFAVDHALMAMYFGIVDRTRVPSLSNSVYELARPGGGTQACFNLGTEFVALAARPFIDATVYVVAPDTFTLMGELTSLVLVRPLARLAIAPSDFPLLEFLWGSGFGPLTSQFGDDYPYLQDIGTWATKRSQISACFEQA
jgi:HEAT repeat protein